MGIQAQGLDEPADGFPVLAFFYINQGQVVIGILDVRLQGDGGAICDNRHFAASGFGLGPAQGQEGLKIMRVQVDRGLQGVASLFGRLVIKEFAPVIHVGARAIRAAGYGVSPQGQTAAPHLNALYREKAEQAAQHGQQRRVARARTRQILPGRAPPGTLQKQGRHSQA